VSIKRRLALLAAASLVASAAPSCRKAPPRSSAPPPVITTATGGEMALLPGGWFMMGSDAGGSDERPAHRVWVDAFLIDCREVTQAQFRALQMPDPSHFKDPNRPVEQVTFRDAMEFCNERSLAEGLQPCYAMSDDTGAWTCDFDANGYRLPTEAEWEYACRAGTESDRSCGPDARSLARCAWYEANSGKTTRPAGLRTPNAWGLYDLYGNVAEWCADYYDPNYYASSPPRNPRGPAAGRLAVIRGGAWNSKASRLRSAARAGENPRFHDACFARDSIGFRCVRKAPQ